MTAGEASTALPRQAAGWLQGYQNAGCDGDRARPTRNKKRARPRRMGAFCQINVPFCQTPTCDFATTVLRHGFSTRIASSEARMLAPAATRNTLSQVPEDCWI